MCCSGNISQHAVVGEHSVGGQLQRCLAPHIDIYFFSFFCDQCAFVLLYWSKITRPTYLPSTGKFYSFAAKNHTDSLNIKSERAAGSYKLRWALGNQQEWNRCWLGLARKGTVSALKMSLCVWKSNCNASRNAPFPPLIASVPISFIASSQYYPGPTVERRRF